MMSIPFLALLEYPSQALFIQVYDTYQSIPSYTNLYTILPHLQPDRTKVLAYNQPLPGARLRMTLTSEAQLSLVTSD